MSSGFDPYREWLGIPAGSRPLNYYQLLGLKPFENEPPVIAEAAAARLARVQSQAQGQHAELANRILHELQAARTTLLQPQTRSAYDAMLRKQSEGAQAAKSAKPLPPPVTASPAPTKPVVAVPVPNSPPPQAMPLQASTPPGPSAVPVFATPITAQPIPQAAPSLQGSPEFGTPSFSPKLSGSAPLNLNRRRTKSSTGSTILVLGSGLALLLAALAYAFREQWVPVAQAPPTPFPGEAPAVAEPASPSPRIVQLPRKPPSPPQVQEDLSQAMSQGFNEKLTPNTTLSTTSRSRTNRPVRLPTDMSDPGITALTAFTPPQTSPAQPDEIAAVSGSLKQVRTALENHDLEQAKFLLDLAAIQAFSTETLVSIEQMKQLVTANEEFWKTVAEGLKTFQPMQELSYDGQAVIFLESEPGRVSIRLTEGRRDFLLYKIPLGLAELALAKALEPDDPRAKYLLGAFLAVEPKADRQRAQELLTQAGEQGVDTTSLLALLNAPENGPSIRD